jgi:argonaute-like protein implicated in RNA metabolism and viral defense
MLLKAENLADVESLAQVMRAASNYGFAIADQGGWRLLPAVFRYLDRFEELARKAPDEPGDEEVEEAEL